VATQVGDGGTDQRQCHSTRKSVTVAYV
jgi:hypothetical protein